jgi:hypothetical protein
MSRVISLIALALAAAAVAASSAGATAAGGSPKVDPLAVGYLQGQGYTPAQIRAWTVGACSHQVKPRACFGPSRGANLESQPAKVDPLAVGYLIGQGLTPAEVRSWTVGACSHATKDASCFAVFDRGRTVVSSAGGSSGSFDWSDAGIGAGVAIGTLLVLGGMGAGVLLSRQNRRRETASA